MPVHSDDSADAKVSSRAVVGDHWGRWGWNSSLGTLIAPHPKSPNRRIRVFKSCLVIMLLAMLLVSRTSGAEGDADIAVQLQAMQKQLGSMAQKLESQQKKLDEQDRTIREFKAAAAAGAVAPTGGVEALRD